MDLAEITRQIRVRIGDLEEPYKYSTNLLHGWINTAYLAIQLESDQWEFHHERDAFITTIDGTADYTLPLIKILDQQSLYFIPDGQTAHQTLLTKTYQTWEWEQRNVELSPGPPNWIIQTPDQQWKVDPEPNGIYVIYADRWLRPTELALAADEPLWEAEYHKVLLYEALKIAVSLRPDEPLSRAAAQEITNFLPQLRKAFTRRYLPAIGNAGPML
jgi:hypothetical protein